MEVVQPKIPRSISQRISAEQAYHYRIMPFKVEADTLYCYTDRDPSEAISHELSIVLSSPVALNFISASLLDQYLSIHYRQSNRSKGTILKFTPDFLERVIMDAQHIGSSDIHFEPYENQCRIRYRLDGKLIEQHTIPFQEYPTIANKIKIRAALDIAEKRLPQDGRITMNLGNDPFDVRVSSMPTLFGEKLVLRILNRDTENISLETLGFTGDQLRRYREGIRLPNGIVLISGPTGSGKTTTLYATLKLLNKEDTNILTIEDPIEYTLEGVNQVQLKEAIGLDFASALRTFLRQDPDVIMVGEIRDVKTANMAIRAALTGHLVLATIHTNSAWATVSRLIDMGVPSFLIASTLNLSVAQRLVRVLCPDCKEEHPCDPKAFPEGYTPPSDLKKHYVSVGCTDCHFTGYLGRKALYEVIPIKGNLEEEIKANTLEVSAVMKSKNITTLADNAIRLVKEGVTTIEEVYPLLIHK